MLAEFPSVQSANQIRTGIQVAGDTITSGEIKTAVGKKRSAVSNLLTRMVEKGQIQKVRLGVYSLPQRPSETSERVKLDENAGSQVHDFHRGDQAC